MKQSIKFSIGFLLMFFTSVSIMIAAELPTLTLDEGANRVGLTLCNRSDIDLSSVSVSIDPNKLPTWLSAECDQQTVGISRGANALDKINIEFTVRDAPIHAETTIPLTVRDASGKIWEYTFAIKANGSKPTADTLIGNYPNPFNPSTTIRFSLKNSAKTKLVIYNSLGQVVRTLVNAPVSDGFHSIQWNGNDEYGMKTASGVYFYRFSVNGICQTRKMVLAE